MKNVSDLYITLFRRMSKGSCGLCTGYTFFPNTKCREDYLLNIVPVQLGWRIYKPVEIFKSHFEVRNMTRKGHGIPACCGQAPNRDKEAFWNRNGKMEKNEEIVEESHPGIPRRDFYFPWL